MSRRQQRQRMFDAARVRVERDAKGLTNEQLAREVGVTLRTVQRWQSGEATPAGHQVLGLATALGIDSSLLYLTAAAPVAR